MRTTIIILALLLSGIVLHADEDESELAAAQRTIREQTLTIQLLQRQVEALEAWNAALYDQQEAQAGLMLAARKGSGRALDVVKAQIDGLRKALETERTRSGVDEVQLGKQLAKEQGRHANDVQMLASELAAANEMAEHNRLEATQALQRTAVLEEGTRRLRDHLAHAVRLLGEIGAPARIALPWLKETAGLDDPVLADVAKTAAARIEAQGK